MMCIHVYFTTDLLTYCRLSAAYYNSSCRSTPCTSVGQPLPRPDEAGSALGQHHITPAQLSRHADFTAAYHRHHVDAPTPAAAFNHVLTPRPCHIDAAYV